MYTVHCTVYSTLENYWQQMAPGIDYSHWVNKPIRQLCTLYTVQCTVHWRITGNKWLLEQTTVNGLINQSGSYVHCTVHWRTTGNRGLLEQTTVKPIWQLCTLYSTFENYQQQSPPGKNYSQWFYKPVRQLCTLYSTLENPGNRLENCKEL